MRDEREKRDGQDGQEPRIRVSGMSRCVTFGIQSSEYLEPSPSRQSRLSRLFRESGQFADNSLSRLPRVIH